MRLVLARFSQLKALNLVNVKVQSGYYLVKDMKIPVSLTNCFVPAVSLDSCYLSDFPRCACPLMTQKECVQFIWLSNVVVKGDQELERLLRHVLIGPDPETPELMEWIAQCALYLPINPNVYDFDGYVNDTSVTSVASWIYFHYGIRYKKSSLDGCHHVEDKVCHHFTTFFYEALPAPDLNLLAQCIRRADIASEPPPPCPPDNYVAFHLTESHGRPPVRCQGG